VTISLAMGSRRLAARSVIVKRLVAIEDLGNIEVLFTDKTGTLTKGELTFRAAIDGHGQASSRVLALGLACHEDVIEERRGRNPLDRALREAHDADGLRRGWRTIAVAPFDYERRLVSALVEDPQGERLLVIKGAPEAVIERCRKAPASSRKVLEHEFAAGQRVVAVATRAAPHQATLSPADERDLTLSGFLIFADPPKPSAANALSRLAKLGIAVKLVTGDNDRVSRKVCEDLALPISGVLRGDEVEAMSDAELAAALPRTTIFARMTPEQKSRVIRLQRKLGRDVAFLGDGVNDAIALHDADVGISVDSGSEVAKDAADIVLLRKDLGVLAGGVVEGRRIFTNTIKYVLMGTSSNFGNMFSAAGASLFLPFLPMLPSQILLNNLLYDVSEMAIPTDRVDEELLERPARWDTAFIRRFMSFFGSISSVYDFLTFAILLYVFHADPTLFHSGWFVESLATQTLVIFIIRTRRVPFFRSAPSLPLAVTTGMCLAAGVALPFSPLAGLLGFTPLPARFLGALALMVVTYLALAQAGIAYFFRPRGTVPLAAARHKRERRVHRLASRWSLGAHRKRRAS
jgi:P-type Mg2+ transporter